MLTMEDTSIFKGKNVFLETKYWSIYGNIIFIQSFVYSFN